MAESDWPIVERALLDHLPEVTSFDWQGPGNTIGTAIPVGVLEQVGGSSDGLDLSPDIEVTVVAATRTGCWLAAQQVDRAILRGLNPGGAAGVYIDEATLAFGWAIDPDRETPSYAVATATYTLTVRPQAAEEGNTDG